MLHRWAGFAIALAAAAACGTLDNTSEPADGGGSGDGGVPPSSADGGGDASADSPGADVMTSCAVETKFEPPRELEELDTMLTQDSPRLSPDETLVVFHAQVASGVSRLFAATRSDRTQKFGPPAPLAAFPAATGDRSDITPFLSPDLRTLYFSSTRDFVTLQLYVTHRATPLAAWDDASTVFVTSADRRFAYVGPDGRLWWAELPASGTQSAIWSAELDGGAATLVVDSGSFDYSPVVSGDGKTLYFTSYKGGSGLELHRAPILVDGGVGAVVHIDELSVDLHNEHAGWISPDGCRLYFSNEVDDDAGNVISQKLYVAERKP